MKHFLYKYTWENVFYLLSARMVLFPFSDYQWYSGNMDRAQWIFPLNIMAPASGQEYLLWVKLCSLIFLVMALVPRRCPPLALTLWLIAIALLNSFGTYSYSNHGWLMVALGASVAFLIDRKDHRLRFEYAIVACTSIYAASGLWKLRFLLTSGDVILTAKRSLPHHVAYGVAENFHPENFAVLQWLQNHPWWSAVIWLTVIATQIGFPLAILLLSRWRFLLVIPLYLFHFGAKWTVGPSFQAQQYVLIFIGMVAIYYDWIHPTANEYPNHELLPSFRARVGAVLRPPTRS